MDKIEKINDIRHQVIEIKPFTCPDYPNLNICSNQYYKNILEPKYNATKNDFAYIYMDFDKLSLINELYSKDER